MRKQPQFPEDERISKEREELIERVRNYLPIVNWDFTLSYVSPDSNEIIFDSGWCRFSVNLYGGLFPIPSEEELRIRYGRLHAPDAYPYMEWNGEKCHCWHRSPEIFYFLEGYSPKDIVDKNWEFVPAIRQYWSSEEGNDLRRRHHSEFVLKLEALLWERHGQHLFELFDLRRPELWEQYRQYLKEIYNYKNWQPYPLRKGQTPKPLPWLVC